MKAVCMIRPEPHYRSDAFARGLRAAGYEVGAYARPGDARDLLVIWNRYGSFAQRADAWEAHGGTVLVAENGYLGVDAQGRQHYALAAHGHNGSGWWPIGSEDRFSALGLRPQAWRSGGEYIIVRGQRGIGTKQMASPPNWHYRVATQIKLRATLPVRVLEHPGRHAPTQPVACDLAGAAACVIWCSALGVKALMAGVPVWYDAPHWICADGGRKLSADPRLAEPVQDDGARMLALHKMAHAQWSVDELESGEPFARFRDQVTA